MKKAGLRAELPGKHILVPALAAVILTTLGIVRTDACPRIGTINVNPSVFYVEEQADLTFVAIWPESEDRKPWDSNRTWQWQVRTQNVDGVWSEYGAKHTETGGSGAGSEQGQGGMHISTALPDIDGPGTYQIRVRALGEWTDDNGDVQTDYAPDAWSQGAEFNIVDVAAIEYCRLDTDQSSEDNWSDDILAAAGALDTPVHKAKVRITITPALAGVSIVAERNGGAGHTIAATFNQNAPATDADGRVFGEYKTSDNIETGGVKVVECLGWPVDIDLDSKIQHKWDLVDDGNYDFEFENYFVPGEEDPVKFFPTLKAIEGIGAIKGHTMKFHTPSVEFYWFEWNLATDAFAEDVDTASFPNYAGIPFGQSVDALIVHTATSEVQPGRYQNGQTVEDYWEYDDATETLRVIEPQEYYFGIYDLTVFAD